MGIFDFFSSGPAEKAAADQQAAAQQAYAQYAALNQQAQQALQQNYGQARTDINQYFPQAAQALQTNYAAGLQPATTAAASTQAGVNQLLSALGITPPGGAPTTGAPSSAWPTAGSPASPDLESVLRATPGFQFALDTGTQNVMRNQAASGSLGSGGSDAALMQYGTGLANQNYNNYINSLLPFLQQNTATTGNVLGGYGSLGSALGSTLTGQGTGLAGVSQNLGSGIAGLLSNQGSAAYGSQMAQGQAKAGADLAPYQASANLWNTAGNLLKGATSLFGAFG
jgi:hypothetical protein